MQLKTLIPLSFLLLNSSTVSALSQARVWANFYPSCPADHSDDDSTLHLNEQFTTAVDIKAEVCQEIPVPMSFATEVDHLAIDAELFYRESMDECRVEVHELAGCGFEPLIHEKLKHGQAVSSCQPRQFAYTQVWLKLTCEKISSQFSHVAAAFNGTHTYLNHTVPAKRMVRERRSRLPFL